MGYKTITTKIASARSTKSKQTTSYQYPTGNGVVLTGSSINSQTSAYLDVTTPGAARSFTAVSGGGTSTVISNIQYLDANNVVANAIAASTTGGNILINGNGFADTNRVYVNNQLVTNTFVNSNAIIATLSANSVGNVTLAVFNSSGQSGVFSNSNVRFSGAPSWVTAAAVSSVNGIASNIALQASGDGTLTYALKSGSGSLPTGITLLSSGYLTGTATGYSADTVVSFTLIVSDNESQEAQQNFNYTVFIGDTYFKQTSLLLSATVSNTFISDSSTNNFLITRNGDTRPSRLSPYWPGGWSGYFDGTGDSLTFPQNTVFNLGTSNFTIEGWVNFTTTTGSLPIFSIDTTSFPSVLIQNESGVLKAYATSASTSWDILNGVSLGNIVSGVWYHFALTRSGSTFSTFINGVLGATVTSSTAIENQGGTGRIGASDINVMNGYISNFRLVKGTALYTANFTPSTTSLTTVANTSLLTLRDAILADDSPYNFTITRNGDTRLTTFSPFNTTPHTITANTNSVYFDGTGDWLTVTNNTAFDISADFTVEAWVYITNSTNRDFTISGKWDNLAYAWVLGANPSTGNITLSYGNSGTYVSGAIFPSSFTSNTWAHIAVTRSGSNVRAFLNGLQIGNTQTITSNMTATATLYVGRDDGTTRNMIGYISNLRILKGTAQYTANFTPSTTALTAVANTSILTCQANTIIDSNTTPKTITVNGNPNVSLANPFGETVSTISNYTWSPTSYGASAYFDGTGDSLTIAANSAFSFGTGDFTVEFWFNLGSASGNYQSMLLFTHSGGSFIMRFGSSGDYSSYLQVGIVASAASNVYSTNLSQSALFGQWTHFAFTRQSSTCRVFVNGIQRSLGTGVTPSSFTLQSFSDSTNIASSSTVYIGSDTTPSPFTGYITDLRVTKGTALYTGPFIPPTAPVSNVANVSLLTLQSDIGSNSAQFVDQSPNNHLITRNGNASQGTYGPHIPNGWSGYFDGSGDYLTVAGGASLAFGSGDFSLEAFVYPTTASGTRKIYDGRPNTTAGNYPVLDIDDSNTTRFLVDATTLITGTAVIPANAWTHILVSRVSGNLRMFINGVQDGSTVSNSTNFVNGTARPAIGIRGSTLSNDPYTGYISNMRVLIGSGFASVTVPTAPVTAITNTSLLTLRGPAFTDDSGNNFTITRNGDTKIVPFGPFSPQTVTPDSYSYRFSNASDYISTTSSNLAFGSNNWTIESWVYPRFTANSGVFQVSNVQYGLTNSNLNTVAMGFSSTNKAIVRVANATYTSTGTSITANTWTHLALVKSSNISKLYINGTLDSTIGTSGSITDTVSYTGTTNVAVGGYGSTSALANAYISNFRVVSNSAVYIENFTPAVGPLSAISGTTLLTCQANTVIDNSAANLTITANANVTPANFNPFDETVTVGQQYSALADGGSAYFDGSGDYLTVASDAVFALGTNDFTLEAWVFPTSGGNRTLISSGTTTNRYEMYITSGHLLAFVVQGVTIYTSTGTVLTNAWNHVAVTRSGGTLRMFVNGASVFTPTTVSNSLSQTGIGIGGQPAAGGNAYTGYISNLRVVNGTALYTANFTPPTAPAIPTTANTSLLLNFTSSGVIDSTGRNILETVADAKVTTNLKKYGTGSYYFDGTGDYMYVMGNSTELAFGTGDFTIEFWVYFNASSNPTLVDYRPASTAGLYPTIYVGTNLLYYFTNSANRITGSTTLTTATWYHVAVARASGVTKMFLNGVQEGSNYTDTNNYINSTSRPVIGDSGSSLGAGPLNGYIADLRITKGYARYTANFTVPSEPFITK